MPTGGKGMQGPRHESRNEVSLPFAGAPVIQFGIFCCAITMVIVLAVAIFGS